MKEVIVNFGIAWCVLSGAYVVGPGSALFYSIFSYARGFFK